MQPFLLACENCAVMFAPTWASRLLTVAVFAGPTLAMIGAYLALSRRGRRQLVGLLIVGCGVALPAAALTGLRGRSGFELGDWNVTCERPVVADVPPIIPDANWPPGARQPLDTRNAVRLCRELGAPRVRTGMGFGGIGAALGIAATVVAVRRPAVEVELATSASGAAGQ